jgi:hypothetical protein
MLYCTTWLISKLDPFKNIFENPYLSSRIAKCKVLLVEYNIVYMTRKVVKESTIADNLTNYVVEDYELLNLTFLMRMY